MTHEKNAFPGSGADHGADDACRVRRGGADPTITIRYGALSMLNMPEEEMAQYMIACFLTSQQNTKQGGDQAQVNPKKPTSIPKTQCVYFDSLDAMLMSLNAGEISSMIIYNTVADYLCANNEQLGKSMMISEPTEDQVFASIVSETLGSNDFAFMMMAGNEELRDAFNTAITDIKNDQDGTLARLIADYIVLPTAGGEIVPVEMPEIDDPKPVRVAITGSLPPMDYIAPDGTPAGFNTALLAEISKRINRKIELVQVDSMGRAAALASGQVDAVFWTRTNQTSNKIAGYTDEEKAANIEKFNEQLTDEEKAVLNRVEMLVNITSLGRSDMPEGTIITEPYYSDRIVPVINAVLVNAAINR